MVRMHRALIQVVLLLVVAFAGEQAFAQNSATQSSATASQSSATGPTVILAYYDNGQQITITNKAGMQYQLVNFGMELFPGDQVSTRNSTAELQLSPNGTIIKLGPYTDFAVDSLQGRANSKVNGFTLKTGILRAVAAKIAGSSYQFRTDSAVGGVRGTDFGMQVIPGKTDALFVKEGSVEFTKKTGQAVLITAGHFADALAPTFAAAALSAQQLASLYKNLDFTKLDVAEVPGHQPAPQVAKQTAQPAQQAPAQPKPAASKAAGSPGALAFLQDLLSFEIGGVSIDGTTYSQLVVEPHFQVGKLKMALYLPVIYTSNLFDAGSWYHPAGNNEWSFGFDQPNLTSGIQDFVTDLFLKIRYVEWGKQRDPFFFKIGNLNDMTLGHGILMYNFANDSDFPAVRRTGLDLGIDFSRVGFESVVNDLGNPQIFGGRLYFRPLGKSFPAALGISAVADISPASELDPSTMPSSTPLETLLLATWAKAADPIFLNLAADFDLPILNSDPVSLILFSDVAGMIPYVRNSVDFGTTTIVSSGFRTNALFYTTPSGTPALRNFGVEAGVMGNLLGLTYRLEYRLFNGVFRPAFYNSTYERLRGQYAEQMILYLYDLDNNLLQNSANTMGIYGEAGFSLFKAVTFKAGYFWPWTMDSNGQIEFWNNDYLSLKISINKKVLPLGFYGSISYARTDFVPTLLNDPAKYGQLSLFDANTVVSGEIVYPAAPTLDLVLRVTTTVSRNSSGNVNYDQNGNPIVTPSVSIETRIGF